jgi:hypothetical protein
MTKINPFKVIRKTGKVIGYSLVGLIYGALAILTGWIMIAAAWPHWGAWAITVPFLFIIGAVLAGIIWAAIGTGFTRLGYWYRAKEYAWNNKHIHNVTDD